MQSSSADHIRRAKRAFWSTLCIADSVAFVRKHCTSLAERANFPTQLSLKAPAYRIKPKPELVDNLCSDGRLQYDAMSDAFTIQLQGRRYRAIADLTLGDFMAGHGSKIQRSLLPRARFTYAHEFAHRLFYVRRGAKEERVQDLVLREVHPNHLCSVQTALYDVEERTCDKIAGSVLLPVSALRQALLEKVFISKCFWGALREVQTRHAVTTQCVLVRLQHAIREGAIGPPSQFCLFSIRWTMTKGRMIRKIVARPRIEVVIMPEEIGSSRVRGLFPGIDVENLGGRFQERVVALLDDGAGAPKEVHTEICLLLNKEERKPLIGTFRGWSVITGWDDSKRLTMWGAVT